jgi:hypothetical protein
MSLAVKALNDRIETLSKIISQSKERTKHNRNMLRSEENNIATAQAEISELMGSVKELERPKVPVEPPTMVHLDSMMWDALVHLIPDRVIFHPIPSPGLSAIDIIELRTPTNKKVWIMKDRKYAGESVEEPVNKFGFEKSFAKERDQTVESVDQQSAATALCPDKVLKEMNRHQERFRSATSSCDTSSAENSMLSYPSLRTVAENLRSEFNKAKERLEKCMAEARNYQAYIDVNRGQQKEYEEMATRNRDDMERIMRAAKELGFEVK